MSVRRVHADSLVGVTEIAQKAKVTSQAVCNWAARHADFPRPVVDLASGPIFNWHEVERWLIKTGRSL